MNFDAPPDRIDAIPVVREEPDPLRSRIRRRQEEALMLIELELERRPVGRPRAGE